MPTSTKRTQERGCFSWGVRVQGKSKKEGEGRGGRRKEGGKKEEDRETITIDKSECTPTKSTLNLQRKM